MSLDHAEPVALQEGIPDRLAYLVPVLGVDNVRRMAENPLTEEDREAIAEIVRRAPRPVR